MEPEFHHSINSCCYWFKSLYCFVPMFNIHWLADIDVFNSHASATTVVCGVYVVPHSPHTQTLGTSNLQQLCSLHLESEDLPFERDDKWLNMDQLEHDKLRWLTPLDKEDKKKKDQKNKVRNILSIIIKTMSILFRILTVCSCALCHNTKHW